MVRLLLALVMATTLVVAWLHWELLLRLAVMVAAMLVVV